MYQRYNRVTADLDPPFGLVDLAAFDANAADLVRRAGDKPIRVASKSLRCRALIERVLSRPGFRGVMCYTLREALWLHENGISDDLLIGYPTADRGALRALAAHPEAREHITIMADSVDHLDFVDAVLGAGHQEIKVCVDLDVSWEPVRRVHIGTWRSPLHSPEDVAAFAEQVVKRPGFRLAGLMGYEGQIAGLGDNPASKLRGVALRVIQRRSAEELWRRRTAAVRRITDLSPLEFVNGGGTGSLESTTTDPSVTELAAGSGLVGPLLFDAYRKFHPRPALLYALPVVRRPGSGIATLFSGGYVASGTGTKDRLPRPFLPTGLSLTGTEGAGEVQTPVRGAAADGLRIGDRVWMRHAKAGELGERVTEYHLVSPDDSVTTVPTYRGENQCFG
ncbi:MAG: amino acid deaminase/aldolase [Streptosporangiaceae bacterium]|jgi:D-serine deaminase-like pyridoxal phosphate-dependent protein